jgi:hypothetical protein
LDEAFQGIGMAVDIADDVVVIVNRHGAKLAKKWQGILWGLAVNLPKSKEDTKPDIGHFPVSIYHLILLKALKKRTLTFP